MIQPDPATPLGTVTWTLPSAETYGLCEICAHARASWTATDPDGNVSRGVCCAMHPDDGPDQPPAWITTEDRTAR
jgi:hypothetical protein